MLRVTPIYGSTGHHEKSNSISLPPSCTLIEWGNCRVLVNAGYDESFPNVNSNSNSSEVGSGLSVPMSMPPAVLPEADAVLVTDSSLHSIGGLPRYFRSHSHTQLSVSGTSTPIYATFPTVKMGQMNLYDHHANISLDGGNPGFTLADVDSLFSPYVEDDDGNGNGNGNGNVDIQKVSGSDGKGSKKNDNNASDNMLLLKRKRKPIQTLKYAQTIIINDPQTQKPAIAITPHRAGHLIGASYFTLKRLTDETEVVVAPIYHHAKEKHLDSSTLYKFATACDVLITTCGGPGGKLGNLYIPQSQQKHKNHQKLLLGAANANTTKPILNPPSVGRDEGELVEMIMSTLRRGGNVLLPVDASGRVLELLYLLNDHWERNRLGSAYNLCWVGSMVHNTIEFARSQLEWMAAPLGAMFDSQGVHPYALKSVQMFSTVGELDADTNCISGGSGVGAGAGVGAAAEGTSANPTCVLASGASLDNGPARDLFLKWSENADNGIIFTDSRRCVQRGSILQAKAALHEKRANQISSVIDKSMEGGKLDNATNDASTPSVPMPIPINPTAGSETPTMVQEDDEGGGGVNIGTAITIDNVSNYSTSAQLLLKWCEAKAIKEEMADIIECDTMIPKRAPLAGAELKSFLAQEESKRLKEKAEEERRAMLREVELAKGRLRLNEDEPSQAAPLGNARLSKIVAATKGGRKEPSTKAMSSRPKKKSRFDADLFLKFSKPCHMTFEVREEAVGIGQPDSIAKYGIGESIGKAGEVLEDDYGIAVEADRFMDIGIRDDTRRGLGFGSDAIPIPGAPSKRQGGEKGSESAVDTAEEEFAQEANDLSEGTGIIRGRNNRPPVKVTTEPRRVEVLAEVAYVPLEARVDARAARQSIRALQPRQIVILGAGKPNHQEEDTRNDIDKQTSLLSYVTGGRESTFAPTDGEMTELSVGHAAYAVRLIDTPYMTAQEKERILAAGEEISNVEAYETKVGDCTVSLLDSVATGQRVAADGSIVLAPRSMSNRKRPNVMLSDGDVLLTDMRAEVIAQGMKAEYSAHAGYSQLVVNGRIVVRKEQDGQINVEGPLCEDFYKVRSVVCGRYLVL